MFGGEEKQTRTILVALGVLALAIFRLLNPYMKETRSMRQELARVTQEMNDARNEEAQYSPKWEEQMTQKERALQERLPDRLNAGEVLGYFLNDFEEENQGRVLFLSVIYQPPTSVDFKSPSAGDTAVARSARYKIKAEIGQERLVPYLEHVENYPGLFRMESMTFSAPKGHTDRLQMESTLEFYLAPKEWANVELAGNLKKPKPQEPEPDIAEPTWHEIFVIAPPSGKKRNLAANRPQPAPHFSQLLGQSVVFDESLYEEGDTVNGWKILLIDPKRKLVTLRRGAAIEKVKVK